MFKATSVTAIAAALVLMSSAAFAEQGDSSSWGQRGLGAGDPHTVADAQRT